MTLSKLFLLSGIALASVASADSRVINGVKIPKSKFREIVLVQSGNASCSGTVVGPSAVLTAAHCADNKAAVVVTIGNKKYQGTNFRIPSYPDKDQDLALVVMKEEMKGVTPTSIGGSVGEKMPITLVGYGCTQVGGGGGNDGTLFMGQSLVTGVTEHDIVVKGAALCFGDSGGPGYLAGNENYTVIGVASKGNIEDTSYFSRTDTDYAKDFFTTVAEENEIDVCGITTICK